MSTADMPRRPRSSSWPASDLKGRTVRALEFASRCVRSLAPDDGVDPASPATPPVLHEKLVAETAQLLHAVAHLREQHPRVRELVHGIALQLVPHARGETVQAALCLDPGRALDHAMAHVLLSALGYRDERFDALVARSLEMGVAFGPERLPHRRLEQQWLGRIGGWQPAPHATDERHAMADSLLGRPLDVLRSSRLDVYAFTHAVMYATDLGRRRAALPRRRARVAADALAALALPVQTADADLAAELLMTWPMLGLPWDPVAAFVFYRLVELDETLGILPGWSFDATHHGDLPADRRFVYERATCYHSVYVWAFLCAAALRPDAAPPARLRRRRSRTHGAAASLLDLLGAPVNRPPWLQAVHTLDKGSQDTLAPLLLALVLRRAACDGDLPRLRAALETALHAGLVDAPAPLQAAALLRRSQVLSGMNEATPTPGSALVSEPASPIMAPDETIR